jgi:hypothetical protein
LRGVGSKRKREGDGILGAGTFTVTFETLAELGGEFADGEDFAGGEGQGETRLTEGLGRSGTGGN